MSNYKSLSQCKAVTKSIQDSDTVIFPSNKVGIFDREVDFIFFLHIIFFVYKFGSQASWALRENLVIRRHT